MCTVDMYEIQWGKPVDEIANDYIAIGFLLILLTTVEQF